MMLYGKSERLNSELYDFDRWLYIRELTKENEELRRENERLTELLATKLEVESGVLESVDKHTYTELRRRLEGAAVDLLAFISQRDATGMNDN